MKGWLLLAIVLGTHYSYHVLAADAVEARWIFYVFRGIEGTILFYLLSRTTNEPLAVFACSLGMMEEGQTAFCGSLAMHDNVSVPLYSTLCVETIGPLPYAAVAVGALVYLARKRDADKN